MLQLVAVDIPSRNVCISHQWFAYFLKKYTYSKSYVFNVYNFLYMFLNASMGRVFKPLFFPSPLHIPLPLHLTTWTTRINGSPITQWLWCIQYRRRKINILSSPRLSNHTYTLATFWWRAYSRAQRAYNRHIIKHAVQQFYPVTHAFKHRTIYRNIHTHGS